MTSDAMRSFGPCFGSSLPATDIRAIANDTAAGFAGTSPQGALSVHGRNFRRIEPERQINNGAPNSGAARSRYNQSGQWAANGPLRLHNSLEGPRLVAGWGA